jgi:hypothetical protein
VLFINQDEEQEDEEGRPLRKAKTRGKESQNPRLNELVGNGKRPLEASPNTIRRDYRPNADESAHLSSGAREVQNGSIKVLQKGNHDQVRSSAGNAQNSTSMQNSMRKSPEFKDTYRGVGVSTEHQSRMPNMISQQNSH